MGEAILHTTGASARVIVFMFQFLSHRTLKNWLSHYWCSIQILDIIYVWFFRFFGISVYKNSYNIKTVFTLV